MKLNEFNNAFQTEQQCLAYIANLKENKCIRCFNFNLWMGYTLLDTNYIDKWTKKGTIIMANINSYTDEFKKQIVALYQSGKSVSCLVKEYNVTRAATYNWIKQFTNSGSFKTKDNRSVEENELIKLRK